MKQLLLILSFLALCWTGQAQQLVREPSEGKCMVYFIRPSGPGPMYNFQIFDGLNFVGKLKNNGVIAYECDPGLHAFIARSENKAFIEAELEAGKSYAIRAIAVMGFFFAQVNMDPLDPNMKKYDKQRDLALKILARKKGTSVVQGESVEISAEAEEEAPRETKEEETPSQTLAQFERLKAEGRVKFLTLEMTFDLSPEEIAALQQADPNEAETEEITG